MKSTTVIFITAFLLIQSTNGIYFHIREGSVKCFIEEVPEDTLISGMILFLIIESFKVHMQYRYWIMTNLLGILIMGFMWKSRILKEMLFFLGYVNVYFK